VPLAVNNFVNDFLHYFWGLAGVGWRFRIELPAGAGGTESRRGASCYRGNRIVSGASPEFKMTGAESLSKGIDEFHAGDLQQCP
jgi:hypothetical protein